MTNIVQSLENMVEAGVKGIMGLAEGVLSPTLNNVELPDVHGDASTDPSGNVPPPQPSRPIAIPSPAPATTNAIVQTSGVSKISLPKQDSLIQTLDVPSGWIHLQSTYLDGDIGQKRVRSFGIKNLAQSEVQVEVESDLSGQLVFWLGEDEHSISSSASSTSSSSTNAGSPSLHLTLPQSSIVTLFFAFQPSHSVPSTPALSDSPHDDGGFTPRVKPALGGTHSSEMSPIGAGSPSDGGSSELSSFSKGSSQSVAGSSKASYSLQGSRRPEPIHRAFSVHGSIMLRAIISVADSSLATSSAQCPMPHQTVNLPFFATVCRSLFTAAPIDPIQGMVVGSQKSSGELVVDFGSESVVGGRYHRDILLVNRSEIELIWKTTVVSSPYKDAVWFELRDLDSENVFGVDHSSQPVPLPSLSSRHLRLELRAKAAIPEFDFTFLVSNANQSGNVVTCRAVGSTSAGTADESLVLLSGGNVDFGQIVDGTWSRQMITCKNNGDKPIDVKFSATKGYDVVFRLAGVAGEDMDEDIPLERPRASSTATTKSDKKSSELALSRTSTREGSHRGREQNQVQQQGLRDPRAESPMSNGQSTSVLSTNTTSATKSRPSSMYSSEMTNAYSAPGDFGRPWQNVDVDSNSASGFSDALSSDGQQKERDHSQPPSRPLSRVPSRTSSYLLHTGDEGESEEDDEPPFFGGDSVQVPKLATTSSSALAMMNEQIIPNQIEEVTMRPGTEYRIYVLHRPEIDSKNVPEIAGKLRQSNFKVYLDYSPSSNRSNINSTSVSKSSSRRTLNCLIESCTSLISLPEGRILDFGQVTVGASKSQLLKVQNLSQLSAKVEIAAISKVINVNRNVIIIPPFETVEEKFEFFPRRINESYEKECFVRNLLHRKNDQVVEIRSKNVDVYNLTLHSHLYRILTPSGSNFLDFGNVVINAPTVRTMHVENLSHTQLVLDLYASQPEDIGLYIKAEDAPIVSGKPKSVLGNYSEIENTLERITSPPNGELKERFMETLQELSVKNASGGVAKTKSKVREKSVGKPKKEDGEKETKSVGQQVAAALKKGGRGRPVQLYGNSVVFKDRALLEPHEYLDLACGPPVCAHRSPRTKRFALLDSIESEDNTKLSGKNDKLLKLDFAAVAKAAGLVGKEAKTKKKHPHHHNNHHQHHETMIAASEMPSALQSPNQSGETSQLTSPKPMTAPFTHEPSPVLIPPASQKPEMKLNLATLASQVMQRIIPETGGRKSPALTAKRPLDLKMTENSSAAPTDPSKMSVDELLLTIEQHDSLRSSIIHSTLEEEETFVRRTIALRKELHNVISSGKLVPARTVKVDSKQAKGIIVVMTPNGSTRPHVGVRAKRADSRVFIKLVEFDRSLLSNAGRSSSLLPEHNGIDDNALIDKITAELPIRDLIIRSSCVRSVLEVQQTSINFGGCDKGEVREKTIVIHNKSDTIGLFRLRTSGSIASGDLRLGLGRYGVISAFGRKEVANFSFTPSLVGNYQETITVENVLDNYNDQAVAVKAVVRKIPAFKVEPSSLDFGIVSLNAIASTSRSSIYDSIEKSNNTKGKGKNRDKSNSWPEAQSFVLTNVSKHERTFVISITGIPGNFFAELSLTRDEKDAGIALSKNEEDEVEGLLQKMKIARRKGKPEKIAKYQARLDELGVNNPSEDGDQSQNEENENEHTDKAGNGAATPGIGANPATESEPQFPSDPTPSITTSTETALPVEPKNSSKTCTTTLSLSLGPSQKTKILVDLIPQLPRTNNPVGEITGSKSGGGGANVTNADIKTTITVHDKRNTDETVGISVVAIKQTPENTQKESLEKAVKMADRAKNTTTDSLALALMQHSLDLTLNCEVSPTAFCVGSTLYLPSSSSHYTRLVNTGKFNVFPSEANQGLILGDGWSRQIPGNTHAEANALTNFRTKYGELQASFGGWGSSSSNTNLASLGNQDKQESDAERSSKINGGLPNIEEVLKDADCYATMEPCSVRTSGGPSCALELVRAGVEAVYLGVEEPPDFVQCEGVRILEDGGVKVIRTSGLEEACLKAARRGRN
ncbi:uncharacterized protein IL334_005172 [Kwoniella shivajii]|uniref:Uncharacterized protein n=1 Tax=Kwoniella shivajii TaxID=564305 RepID=A0ABZ1D2E6_9TREE|nr:hypothetical protein IL334_005172 [Kwoniella shivajii]